jgi:hypothetical protein
LPSPGTGILRVVGGVTGLGFPGLRRDRRTAAGNSRSSDQKQAVTV